MGAWKVITPWGSINKVLNPIGMGVGNYEVVGAGVTCVLSDSYSYFGHREYYIAGLQAGVFYYDAFLEALANLIHYASFRSLGAITAGIRISVDGVNYYDPDLLGQEGIWFVYGHQFSAAQSNASTKLYFAHTGGGIVDLHLGHIQVEPCSYPTTPITGDRKGFTTNGYYWNGTPHASSSCRSSQERTGGYEYDLETDYKFRVKYAQGMGMPPITHHTQGMALLPGSLYVGHKVEPRVLDLVSAVKENTVATIAHARKHFEEAVKLDATVHEQPVVLRYYGNPINPVEFHGVYDSGMEFQTTSGVVDQPVARFICYDPFAYEVHDESKVLARNQTIADADFVVRRIDGLWSNISTNFNAAVTTFTKGKDGCIYIGGNFTNVGDADGDYLMKWNPYTSILSKLSAADIFGNIVKALATAPNGDIYIGGLFTNHHDANGDFITKWNGTAYSSLGAGLVNGACNCMVFGHSGDLYIGGVFTNLTDANGDCITKWDGAAFSSLGSGLDDEVHTMAIAPNGDLYVTGDFTHSGATDLNYIAKWNGTAWSALGTGLNAYGSALAIDKAGNVYVGGNFTTADGIACSHIAKWNGKTFEPLGSGVSDYVLSLSFDDNGLLYAGGNFLTAGGMTLADKMAVWDGTTWGHLDIDLPGNPIVYSILQDGDNLYIGYSTSSVDGDCIASYTTNIVTSNSGSHYVYPVFKIHRADDGTSAQLVMLKNVTTGHTIKFNYSLQKGETLTVDLTPGNRSVKSDFYGDVWRAVIRGSDFGWFGLLGGTNVISLYVKEVGAPTVTAWMEWKITHWSADTAAA